MHSNDESAFQAALVFAARVGTRPIVECTDSALRCSAGAGIIASDLYPIPANELPADFTIKQNPGY